MTKNYWSTVDNGLKVILYSFLIGDETFEENLTSELPFKRSGLRLLLKIGGNRSFFFNQTGSPHLRPTGSILAEEKPSFGCEQS